MMFKRKKKRSQMAAQSSILTSVKFGETAEKSDLIFIVLKMVTSMMTQSGGSENSALYRSNFHSLVTNKK